MSKGIPRKAGIVLPSPFADFDWEVTKYLRRKNGQEIEPVLAHAVAFAGAFPELFQQRRTLHAGFAKAFAIAPEHAYKMLCHFRKWSQDPNDDQLVRRFYLSIDGADDMTAREVQRLIAEQSRKVSIDTIRTSRRKLADDMAPVIATAEKLRKKR